VASRRSCLKNKQKLRAIHSENRVRQVLGYRRQKDWNSCGKGVKKLL